MTQKNWNNKNLKQIIFVCLALISITFAVYWQVGSHQFINFDDDLYITNNAHVARGFTGSNIVWAFTTTEECNWFPLTRLSHILDVQLFGMNPSGHHLTNVLFHSLSTVLLFLLLYQLTNGFWKSAFVAALFALHPLHIESVAWAAERKDVLSAFLGFITLLLYTHYVKVHAEKRRSATLIYILTLVSFMLGLMAKPMLVTLPILLLLLDYWPLKRFKTTLPANKIIFLLQEKIPFFACSLLSAIITIFVQRKGGAVVTLEWIPFSLRFQNALISYVKYIIKSIWPHDMAVLYPFAAPIPLWQTLASSLIILIVSLAAIRYAGRLPYLIFGWLWFLISLLPVIGLIQVGNQAMADRYSYIPSIGLYILLTWGITGLATSAYVSRVLPEKHTFINRTLGLAAILIIVGYGAVTWHQLQYWKNNFTLYRHTLSVTSGNYIIHYNLGLALGRSGNLQGALQEFQTAVSINPREPDLRNMYASTLADTGDVDAAIAEFRKTLTAHPENMQAKRSLEYWQGWKEKLAAVKP